MPTAPTSNVPDIRRVPLGQLAEESADTPRRVPAGGAPRVPVAAFNASL